MSLRFHVKVQESACVRAPRCTCMFEDVGIATQPGIAAWFTTAVTSCTERNKRDGVKDEAEEQRHG